MTSAWPRDRIRSGEKEFATLIQVCFNKISVFIVQKVWDNWASFTKEEEVQVEKVKQQSK